MGFKARTMREGSSDIDGFIAGIAPEHKDTFVKLRNLIRKVAPQTTETLKWGTLAFDWNGNLFALSAPKKVVNLYILTIGLLAKHQDKLSGIPQSKCCLRFSPGDEIPLPALRAVMKEAVATASRNK